MIMPHIPTLLKIVRVPGVRFEKEALRSNPPHHECDFASASLDYLFPARVTYNSRNQPCSTRKDPAGSPLTISFYQARFSASHAAHFSIP